MKTNPSKPGASRWQVSIHCLEKRLAKLINDLYLFASLVIAKWMVKREVKRRAMLQTEVSYETKKHKLLVVLRRKISGKRSM